MALRTVVSATPATAARFGTDSRQSFRRTVSAATRARTACSASVNRAARPGRQAARGGPAAAALHRGVRAWPGADAGPPGASCAILRGNRSCGRVAGWVRALSAKTAMRQCARLNQNGQRLGLGLRDLPLPVGAPQQRRHGRQGDSVGRLDRAADLVCKHVSRPSSGRNKVVPGRRRGVRSTRQSLIVAGIGVPA